MNQEVKLYQIAADDFARRFSQRAVNLMWLLGAGASASAGVPTATDMVWEANHCLSPIWRMITSNHTLEGTPPQRDFILGLVTDAAPAIRMQFRKI